MLSKWLFLGTLLACLILTLDRHINAYLKNPTTQAALGVDSQHPNFTVIDYELNSRFQASGDYWSFRAEHYLAALLERGIRALIYVGATDWICNWVRPLRRDITPAR